MVALQWGSIGYALLALVDPVKWRVLMIVILVWDAHILFCDFLLVPCRYDKSRIRFFFYLPQIMSC